MESPASSRFNQRNLWDWHQHRSLELPQPSPSWWIGGPDQTVRVQRRRLDANDWCGGRSEWTDDLRPKTEARWWRSMEEWHPGTLWRCCRSGWYLQYRLVLVCGRFFRVIYIITRCVIPIFVDTCTFMLLVLFEWHIIYCWFDISIVQDGLFTRNRTMANARSPGNVRIKWTFLTINLG